MPGAYPVELRERAVNAYHAGAGTVSDVAKLFDIGSATLKRWCWLKRDQGTVSPRPHGGGVDSRLDDADEDFICRVVGERPNIFVWELVEVVAEVRGKRVSRSVMSKTINRLELTRKKGPVVRSARRAKRSSTLAPRSKKSVPNLLPDGE